MATATVMALAIEKYLTSGNITPPHYYLQGDPLKHENVEITPLP